MNPFAIDQEVQVTQTGARRLRSGHLWVYATDLAREPSSESGGPIVRVVDGTQNCLGYAFYSKFSQIRLRLLSRDNEVPTEEWFRSRLQDSIRRRAVFLESGRACRLVYGESDRLPSIIVDRYGEYLVLQTLSRGADALKDLTVAVLEDLQHPAGIVERNDFRARTLEGLQESRGILSGRVPDCVQIEESGIRFDVDLLAGQKTGFFLDQSENRIVAGRYARGTALDCFANTGGFALHFARACESVTAVDISPKALRQAERNAVLNGMSNVICREANVFDYLRELESAGRRYDLICLDPPAFAKSRVALAGARRGYKEINLRAMKLLNPDGLLVTSSCSYHLSESEFAGVIEAAARDAHRLVQLVERRAQASDHPVLLGMPETHYLKCLILRVL